jgi:hypothetical protein
MTKTTNEAKEKKIMEIRTSGNNSEALAVKSNVRAGALSDNHNETVAR